MEKPATGAAIAAAPSTESSACRSRSHATDSGITVFRDCDDSPQMIVLHGGSFRMGDHVGDGHSYERPVHDVRIGAFALGRFEVTNAEYQACVNAGACASSHVGSDAQRGRYPVAGISWIDASAYVDWLSRRTGNTYRLPSESEWEYAARAGNDGRFPPGTFELDPCDQANLLDTSGRREHPNWTWAETCDDHFPGAAPVGSFPPNAWGYYDLLGNVWEWVGDCWHSDYEGAPNDGSAWRDALCRKHVNRGGGWGNNVNALRLSNRDADSSDAHSDGLGFRVARSVTPAEMPSGPGNMPDTRPTSIAEAHAAKTQAPHPTPAAAVSGVVAAPVTMAAPTIPLALERELDVHVTVQGTQTWKNLLQHTDATTAQDFVFSTRLRSDGILYNVNLLDLDPATRIDNKAQYLTRRGLIRLKALNGGTLPRTAEEIAALSTKIQTDFPSCLGSIDCAGGDVEAVSAIDAIRNNSVEDLEAMISPPAADEPARWLYYFGYAGCPISIHITHQTHIAGERAYDRAKKNLKRWALDRFADSNGSAEDRSVLCRRYVVTLNIRTGDVYVENLFIPSPIGVTIRNSHGDIARVEEDLPVPAEVLSWTSAQVRQTHETLTASASLTAHTPLDGDATVMGLFDGKLQTTLTWSFRPVATTPVPSAARPTPGQ